MPRAVVAHLARALIWGTTWYAIRVSIAAYPTLALFERGLPLTGRAYLGAAITLSGLAVSLRRR
ncbi:MAG TPA: hypothetical protein VF516_17365 [Kofleriaceae bacterium]